MLNGIERESLVKAIEQGDVNEVEVFLKEKNVVNMRILTGFKKENKWVKGESVTPLMLAAYSNKMDVVKLLLQYGADPNCKGSRSGVEDPLILFAIRTTNLHLLELLLQNDADPNYTWNDGSMRMNYLVSLFITWPSSIGLSQKPYLELLLKYGADPNLAAHINGRFYALDFAMSLAKRNPHRGEIISLLLKHGADPSKLRDVIEGVGNSGMPLFTYPVMHNEAKLLSYFFQPDSLIQPNLSYRIKAGIFIGKTVYDLAFDKGHKTILKYLMILGSRAVADLQLSVSMPVELIAAYQGNLNILKRMSSSKHYNLMQVIKDGQYKEQYPLYAAVKAGHLDCVKFLFSLEKTNPSKDYVNLLILAYKGIDANNERGRAVYNYLKNQPVVSRSVRSCSYSTFKLLVDNLIQENNEGFSKDIIELFLGKTKINNFRVPAFKNDDKGDKLAADVFKGYNLLQYFIKSDLKLDHYKCLLSHHAMVKEMVRTSNSFALRIAAESNKLDAVRALLGTGCIPFEQAKEILYYSLTENKQELFWELMNYLKPLSKMETLEALWGEIRHKANLENQDESFTTQLNQAYSEFKFEFELHRAQVDLHEHLKRSMNELDDLEQKYGDVMSKNPGLKKDFEYLSRPVLTFNNQFNPELEAKNFIPMAICHETIKQLAQCQVNLMHFELKLKEAHSAQNERKQMQAEEEKQKSLELAQMQKAEKLKKEQMRQERFITEQCKQAQSDIDRIKRKCQEKLTLLTKAANILEQFGRPVDFGNAKTCTELQERYQVLEKENIRLAKAKQVALDGLNNHKVLWKALNKKIIASYDVVENQHNSIRDEKTQSIEEANAQVDALIRAMIEARQKLKSKHKDLSSSSQRLDELKLKAVKIKRSVQELLNNTIKGNCELASLNHYESAAEQSILELKAIHGQWNQELDALEQSVQIKMLQNQEVDVIQPKRAVIPLYNQKLKPSKIENPIQQYGFKFKVLSERLAAAIDSADDHHQEAIALEIKAQIASAAEDDTLAKIKDFQEFKSIRHALVHYPFVYDPNYYNYLINFSGTLAQRLMGYQHTKDSSFQSPFEHLEKPPNFTYCGPQSHFFQIYQASLYQSRLEQFMRMALLHYEKPALFKTLPSAISHALGEFFEVVKQCKFDLSNEDREVMTSMRNMVMHARENLSYHAWNLDDLLDMLPDDEKPIYLKINKT